MRQVFAQLQKFQQLQFFRYLVAAGTATLVDVLAYQLLYWQFSQVFSDPNTRHLFSLILSYSLGLITNFLITKYYVFQNSTLRFQTQFVRFTLVALLVFAANYGLMEAFYTLFPWVFPGIQTISLYPLVVRLVAAGLIAVLSFVSHKLFSFEDRT